MENIKKTDMNRNTFFTYNWFVDGSETDITSIRVYGIGENNENICVRINDFTPYVYIELPTHIPWNDMKAQLLGNKIDEILKDHKPLKKCLMWKQKLYGAHLNEDGSRKKFPYLFCSFSNKNDYKSLSYMIQKKNIVVSGIGAVKLRMHEQDADPILQLTVAKDLPTSGWISFAGNLVPEHDKITLCDLEYKVNWKNMKKCDRATVGLPKIMGFDIEVNSSNPSAMPKAEKPEDKIFQISCVFSREGSSDYESHLLTLGDPVQSIVGVEAIIHRFLNEAELIVGFTELIRKENPNVIVGYNILNFDIPYMIERSKRPGRVNHIFDTLGFHKYNHAKEKTIVWSSSAYKNQEFKFLEAEGRLFIDLLPLVKRDFKMDNYKLKTVSDFFIGETKDPLSVKGIFKCYRIGTKKELDGTYSEKAKKSISIVGRYCLQDSVLVVKLMEKLQTWVGLTEMATVCQVQPFSLFTQGQQIKVYSQVYRYCYEKNIVVEKDGYICKDDERYTGAHVFPPVPGIYNRVVPFDFASLYPTTIIAYNIDYSTLVTDPNVPDSKCHVFEWADHFACCHDPKVIQKNKLTEYIDGEKEKIKKLREKRDDKKNKTTKQKIIDELNQKVEELKPYIEERSKVVKSITKNVMCAHRYYRFLKEPKGVMPTILQNLLDARKNTRKIIKENNSMIKNIDDETKISDLTMLNNVLDKRQWAYKISANSVAGPTPIPCRIDGEFTYKTIEEISKGNWKRINEEQEVSEPIDNLEVWSDMGFTKVKYVMRHPNDSYLYTVNTPTGLVKCTGDHSLLRKNGDEVKPKELKISEELLHKQLFVENYDFLLKEISLESKKFINYPKNKFIILKSELEAAKVFFILSNMNLNVKIYLVDDKGYKITVKDNDDENINNDSIISIQQDEFISNEYVYDLETENHHFAAGVGNMIVHNSMYGAMGVRRGYLPFMAGACCTTFMGRTNIEIVAKTIPEKYGGELVYGDQLVSVMYK